MNLNVRFTEFFAATPERVWAALTDPTILGDWLMPNDFVAEVGNKFTFVPDHPTPWEGNVECEVLELLPHRKMVWSWNTEGMDRPSRVEFELIRERGGTELVFTHTGAAAAPIAEGLKGGWPVMFDKLEARLEK